jgi:hypothetical protein
VKSIFRAILLGAALIIQGFGQPALNTSAITSTTATLRWNKSTDQDVFFLSSCAFHYGTIGRASETQLATDSYRVAFFPTGYIPWDLAYREALLRCAELTIESGYRYFAVSAIENYSSVTNFAPPRKQPGAWVLYRLHSLQSTAQCQHHLLASARSDH